MKNKTPEQDLTEAELIRNLLGGRPFRAFADYLNEKIPAWAPGKTTFMSAWNWANEVHPVNTASLLAWTIHYPEDDPRHQLAIAILTIRHKNDPELSDEDKKKVIKEVFARTKVAKEKARVTA